MTEFSELMNAVTRGGGSSSVEVTADWAQGRTAYGGMTAALCVEAALRAAPDLPPLRSAQFAFIGPAAGVLSITPSVLRSGRSATFVGVDLAGEAGIAARALLCFGASRESSLSHQALPAPAVAAPDDCPAYFKAGAGPGFSRHFDARFAGGARPMTEGAEPELLVWMRHRDAGAHASVSGLVALADAVPAPAIILFRGPTPFSTATWTLDLVTGDPVSETGWWLHHSVADTAGHGYSTHATTLWDGAGRPVAVARQTVAVFG